MSSILKALKKVEKEQSNPHGLYPPTFTLLPIRGVGYGWKRTIQRTNPRFFYLFLGAVILAISGFFVLKPVVSFIAQGFKERQSTIPVLNGDMKNSPGSSAQQFPIDMRFSFEKKKEPVTKKPNSSSSWEEQDINTSNKQLDLIYPQNTILKLQAIAWSKSKKKRIAVINGNILKEGGDVDEYYVVTINRDDVILRKNGVDFKLHF